MERPHSYSYPFQSQGHTRYASSHGTSSAFSASANPNEDWTKISDLAERRRIQNRIAQRNYRKKLKRRLEDLERRAASTSASPEQSHRELARPTENNVSETRGQSPRGQASIAPQMKRQLSPEPMHDYGLSHDDRSSMFSSQVTRQLSASPPPIFSFSTYPPAQPIYYSGYSQQGSMQPMTAPYFDDSYQNHYAPSLHATLPTMAPSSEAIKRENLFADDDLLSPFNMTYASIAGMDITNSQAYSDTSTHTPSLTDSHSFDHSRENSPLQSHLAFPPSPPASLSGSPHLNVCRVR